MNKQTKALLNRGLSLRFNHGVTFAHLTPMERAKHPEFTLIERPLPPKKHCVDSSFDNREKTGNKRRKRYEARTMKENPRLASLKTFLKQRGVTWGIAMGAR
jgi:hypothetical protein